MPRSCDSYVFFIFGVRWWSGVTGQRWRQTLPAVAHEATHLTPHLGYQHFPSAPTFIILTLSHTTLSCLSSYSLSSYFGHSCHTSVGLLHLLLAHVGCDIFPRLLHLSLYLFSHTTLPCLPSFLFVLCSYSLSYTTVPFTLLIGVITPFLSLSHSLFWSLHTLYSFLSLVIFLFVVILSVGLTYSIPSNQNVYLTNYLTLPLSASHHHQLLSQSYQFWISYQFFITPSSWCPFSPYPLPTLSCILYLS